MIILAIETSCDETGISVLKCGKGFRNPRFEILSNIVASQVKVHSQWGGVVPSLAKREHQKNLPVVLKKALKKAEASKIDVIAVTTGPGLEPSLWTGINFAKALALDWKKPLVAVNHLEGHIASVLLLQNRANPKHEIRNPKQIKFPAMALLVSGGHTQLVLVKDWLKYKILGETLDDAAGEAFDKVARMLELGYPGGPAIAAVAAKSEIRSTKSETNSKSKIQNSQPMAGPPRAEKFALPRPMLNSKDYNFSFSGLKTAVLYKLKDIPNNYDRNYLVEAVATEFQQAVIDVLIAKTIRAAGEYKVKTIILAGGVAANKELRRQLKKAVIRKYGHNCALLLPPIKFTGDNAAMIAAAAHFHIKKKRLTDLSKLKADGNLKLCR